MYAGHLDLTQRLVWTVDDALSPAECAAYVDRMRARRAEVAPIVGRDGGAEIDLAVRNNTRLMWDDAQEARALLSRVRPSVPESLSEMAQPVSSAVPRRHRRRRARRRIRR
jgi:hypothetical protein